MGQDRKSLNREEDRRPPSDGPEPHEPPRLIEIGSFDELTQGVGLSNTDAAEAAS